MEEKKTKKINVNECPVQRALEIVGGKWAFTIIYALTDGKKRFKELERSIEGINTRMLVKELKVLETHGIINRKAYATVPPTVEYSLTEKGADFHPVLNNIRTWAAKYIESYNCDAPTAIKITDGEVLN
ncbi:helix-turn-helix domain-containing protein [Chryseolinea sp. H1M3-3]|uniref:winged helix-turn-helix transcriptional regulator n=1 Tax=Chryseolinea sp. H1M3-3 TaxID=3034144 RepID=UPI0023EA8DA9|nr:helix-turn-helix domain-containing protein [Chryseolinea sp. H1M3-3]